jgi:hypothetical protein
MWLMLAVLTVKPEGDAVHTRLPHGLLPVVASTTVGMVPFSDYGGTHVLVARVFSCCRGRRCTGGQLVMRLHRCTVGDALATACCGAAVQVTQPRSGAALKRRRTPSPPRRAPRGTVSEPRRRRRSCGRVA